MYLSIKREFYKSVEQRIPKWDYEKCTKCGLCGSVCKTNAIVSIKGQKPIFMGSQCNGCGACVIKCPVNAISWSSKEIGKIYEGNHENIDLLSGELNTGEASSEFVVNALIDLIEKRKNDYDLIIIDTAAGTHCPVITALEECDNILVVTEPTPLGKHDLEIIIQVIKKLKADSKIVLNRSNIGDKQLIAEVSEKFDVPIACEIPYSEKIVKEAIKGTPMENSQIRKLADEVFR